MNFGNAILVIAPGCGGFDLSSFVIKFYNVIASAAKQSAEIYIVIASAAKQSPEVYSVIAT